MAKYRKKPVVIDAIRWDGGNLLELVGFVDDKSVLVDVGNIFIRTLEGYMEISIGDYIIKGVKGEFYPCKPDVFEMTYEGVTDDGKSS